jgi:hypothetical protein
MTLLICNIGGRDVECAALPKTGLGERAWALAVLERYAELRPALRLPIIGKALRYLADAGTPPEQVVLIASDQPEDADPRFRAGDTCHTAAIVARMLAAGAAGAPAIPAAHIQIWTIAAADGRGGDPSDYDLVLAFLERRLAALAAEHPHGPAFLEVSGGAPAMTTGLLIAGTESFGARAELLSVHPRREQPSVLGAGRRLLAAPLRATLLSNAAVCAYDAALRTFTAERAAIGDRLTPEALDTIGALLAYAHARYNFDFPGARAALSAAPADTPWAAALADLAAQVRAPERRDLLAEVYHGAAARYANGLYADFLTQVVRFEENALRLLCLERGVRFATRDGAPDDDGSFLQRSWLREQPFTLSRDRGDEHDLPTSRAMLRELLGLLARTRGDDLSDLLAALDRLQKLVYLRNDLTHSLDGVHKADLAVRFSRRHTAPETDADAIVPYLAQLYAQVAQRPAPPSPFTAVNGLLKQLLHAASVMQEHNVGSIYSGEQNA